MSEQADLAAALRRATDLLNRIPSGPEKEAAARVVRRSVVDCLRTRGAACLAADTKHALTELRELVTEVLGPEEAQGQPAS